MNRLHALYSSLGLVILLSCDSTPKKSGEFRLLPSPQQFDISGTSEISSNDIKYYFASGNAQLPITGKSFKHLLPTESDGNAQIIVKLEESQELKSEGYKLEISNDIITITGYDNAGLLYGFMTLQQLMEDASDQDVNLPLCRIVDYPLLSCRAIHIDIKHHLEKTSYYYQLMDRLASLKINAIIAEVEDKIQYKRQPLVGSKDALSIEEWKKLSDYAKDRNIEISPLVQGLGHASFILKHEEYKNLRDNPESDWAFNPLDPKTYQVQFDLYLDALEATPHGKYLHIGGDEVHTTGRNSGQSPLELQLNWLNKVCQFAEEQGRIPIFWDDMPLKHAGVYAPMFKPELTQDEVDSIWNKNEHKLLESLDLFPKNCVYMRWNYHSPEAIGNTKAMDWFSEHGLKVMGATAGQTRWVLMPQRESNIENIKSFALSSIKSELDGLLLTLWDDDSPHFELYLRGIHAFAEYTWSGEKRTTKELKTAYRQRSFGHACSDEKLAFIDKLETPVGFWKNALLHNNIRRNSLAKKQDPLHSGIIDLPDLNNKGAWSEKYADRLEKVKELLATCDSVSVLISDFKRQASRNHFNLDVYEQVNELVKFSLQSLVALENLDKSPQEQQNTSMKDIQLIPGKFKALRSDFEEVYSKTRILTKPDSYILDQDHHSHSANQSISFDWQFISELLFINKIEESY